MATFLEIHWFSAKKRAKIFNGGGNPISVLILTTIIEAADPL